MDLTPYVVMRSVAPSGASFRGSEISSLKDLDQYCMEERVPNPKKEFIGKCGQRGQRCVGVQRGIATQ